MKSVRVRIFPGPYVPSFGMNTERYSVFPCIQSECGKIRTRKTLNMDTFHAGLCIKGNEGRGEEEISIKWNRILVNVKQNVALCVMLIYLNRRDHRNKRNFIYGCML